MYNRLSLNVPSIQSISDLVKNLNEACVFYLINNQVTHFGICYHSQKSYQCISRPCEQTSSDLTFIFTWVFLSSSYKFQMTCYMKRYDRNRGVCHVSKRERDVAAGLGSELGIVQERMF